jgi:hypothetical protein
MPDLKVGRQYWMRKVWKKKLSFISQLQIFERWLHQEKGGKESSLMLLLFFLNYSSPPSLSLPRNNPIEESF